VTVSELQDDVRATAASIAADADRLKRIEEAKTELPVADPTVADLTAEAEQLIDEMAAKAGAQSALVDEAVSGA
jgi:hypothetical protein